MISKKSMRINKIFSQSLFNTKRYNLYLMSVKTVVVGETDVGKTCLVMRKVHGAIDVQSKPTIGAGNSIITIEVNGKEVNLSVWDTAGQEKYRSLSSMYFNGAGLAVLVFDITNRASFEVLNEFVTLIREKALPDVRLAVVGNKADLDENRTVTQEEGEKYAKEICADLYIETSATTGFRIEELFQRLGAMSAPQEKATPLQPETDLNYKKAEGSSCC